MMTYREKELQRGHRQPKEVLRCDTVWCAFLWGTIINVVIVASPNAVIGFSLVVHKGIKLDFFRN